MSAEKEESKKSTKPKVFFNEKEVLGRKKAKGTELKRLQQKWQPYEEPEGEQPGFPRYFYAGFWMRSFAFVLDLLCISAIQTSTVGLVYSLLGLADTGNYFGLYNLFCIGIYLAYFTLLTKFNHGQTIGKMAFGLRVVSVKGELTWGTILIRETVCRFILMGFPLIIGYLPAAFSKYKQHVGDYFSETSVVTVNLIKAFNKELI
ncbi:RDD family protein [Enterococcus sp. 2201sp1_2201st1_B8_2201SCRN_220225]|uniref:RDD family protein n=1 Tax=unclassified Enterococcus TaxID=2608891 RepID=UPI0034A45499